MQLFKFKAMQRRFYLMPISNTYATPWLFAEILPGVTTRKETAWFDAFTEIAVALLLSAYCRI
ncbi:MAG: hypothetical protein V1708_04490 [Candidatus Micrarchaeota archaeon]